MKFLHLIINQLQIAQFRNTKINQELPENYFSEENLLPPNWDKHEELPQFEKKSPDDLVGKPYPKWELPMLGSDETYSSDNFKDKTVLVEFTATWCGHCFEAAEMMNRLENKFENDENVEIVSIFSSDFDKKESIERFVQKMNVKPIILYSGSAVGDEYYVKGYPKFFIISPEGKIIKSYQGFGPSIEEEIINELSKQDD